MRWKCRGFRLWAGREGESGGRTKAAETRPYQLVTCGQFLTAVMKDNQACYLLGRMSELRRREDVSSNLRISETWQPRTREGKITGDIQCKPIAIPVTRASVFLKILSRACVTIWSTLSLYHLDVLASVQKHMDKG